MKFRILLALLVMLTLGFAASAQCGDKINVYFQTPQDSYDVVDGYVSIKDVKVTLVQTGESYSLPPYPTNGLRQLGPFSFNSGYGAKLFRFEWGGAGGHAIQVVDVWIQFPSLPRGDYFYDIPAHNVTFIKDLAFFANNERVDARVWSSRDVDYDQVSSAPNQNGNTGTFIGSLMPYKTEVLIPMLDGCYSVTAAWGEFGDECGWPDCRLNHADWAPNAGNGYSALCVGGDRDASQLEVVLQK